MREATVGCTVKLFWYGTLSCCILESTIYQESWEYSPAIYVHTWHLTFLFTYLFDSWHLNKSVFKAFICGNSKKRKKHVEIFEKNNSSSVFPKLSKYALLYSKFKADQDTRTSIMNSLILDFFAYIFKKCLSKRCNGSNVFKVKAICDYLMY